MVQGLLLALNTAAGFWDDTHSAHVEELSESQLSRAFEGQDKMPKK